MFRYAITLILAGCMFAPAALAEDPVQIELNGVQWISAFQADDLHIQDGLMKFTSQGYDPYLETRDWRIDAGRYDAVRVRLAVTGGTDAQLFWAPWSERRSVTFTVIPDGRMHEYILPVGENSTWTGQIDGFRFDPVKQPAARIAIAEITPIEASAQPRLEVAWLGPDHLIISAGTLLPLSFYGINVGGGEVRYQPGAVSTGTIVAHEPHRPAAAATLAAGEAGPAHGFSLEAGREGDGELTLAAGTDATRQIDVTVVSARAADYESAGGTSIDFRPVGDSRWVAPGPAPRPIDIAGGRGIALDVSGRRTIHLGGRFGRAEAIRVLAGATGDMTALAHFTEDTGRRVGVAFAVGETDGVIAIPTPGMAGPVTLDQIDLYGDGELRIGSLTVVHGGASPQVVLQGDRFYRNERPWVEGYVVEQGSTLTIRTEPSSDRPVRYELSPVQLGAGLGRESSLPSVTGQASGDSEVAIDIAEPLAIGAYTLRVTGGGLAEPFEARLMIVASRERLAALQHPQAGALYGRPRGSASRSIPEFTDYPGQGVEPARNATLTLYETDLSPAWLVHSRAPELRLFADLNELGLGQATRVAVPTAAGVRVLAAEGEIDQTMSESWLLVWFAGSPGWNLWDVPHLVVLQHRPREIRFDGDGLALQFADQAGYVATLPLYGFYRPPQQGELFLSTHGLPERGVETWTWADGLPESVIRRCTWWSRALKRYPVNCHEDFNVDPGEGTITVRDRFEYIDIADDWRTEPLTVAPLSPTLAFTQLTPGFPVTINAEVADPDLMTPYGPYMVVQGADEYSYTATGLLDFINEAEIQGPVESDHPAVEFALRTARDVMDGRFRAGPEDMVEFDRKLFVWAQLAEHVFAKGLAYADDRTTALATGAMANYYNTFFFGTGDQPADGDRGWWRPDLRNQSEPLRRWYRENTICIDGPGIHGGLFGDSGKISASGAYNLWSYAHYAGDHGLVRRRWDFIRRMNTNAVNMDFKAMGRHSNAESGEHMPPVLAYARLAYLAGDMDAYYFGAYCFLREALMMYVKQRPVGGEYFRMRQPYVVGGRPMPFWALPNHVLGEAAGWIVDAPGFTPIAGVWRGSEVQTNNRWVRFSSEDAARLWREHLRDQAEEELTAMRTGEFRNHSQPVEEKVSFTASMLRLHSYLLDPDVEQLIEWFPPARWQWTLDNNGSLMMALAVIRTAQDRQYQRLIPRDTPASGFVTGLARQPVTAGWRGLLLFRWNEDHWPRARWFMRGGPSLGGDSRHFSFGRIVPGQADRPGEIESRQINWTTRVTAFR